MTRRERRRARPRALVLVGVLLIASCSDGTGADSGSDGDGGAGAPAAVMAPGAEGDEPSGGRRPSRDATATAPSPPATTSPATGPTRPVPDGAASTGEDGAGGGGHGAEGAVDVAVALENRVEDPGTADFVATATAVLTDDRGWRRAGFRILIDPGAPFRVVLAEPAEVDALCAPYRTGGRYSCQIGGTVALNAERWRRGVEHWPGPIEEYRTMLVNHEVGHLLGQHHPIDPCPDPGVPAPVMAQQSKELAGCAPGPWPLPWEIACAASGVEPLAPAYEPEATPLCGP